MGMCVKLVENYKPHFVMSLCFLSLAAFIVLLQSLLSGGVSGPVLVVYEHVLATLFLSPLAFFTERDKRPPLTFQICCWSFFLGFLQITLGQLLMTTSLTYISATTQTIGLNTVPAVTFFLAVVFRREIFGFLTINGQAKLWGILLSLFGATVMVTWTGPKLHHFSLLSGFPVIGNQLFGCLMLGVAILSVSAWNLLVERMAVTYPADMSLSAMMSFWGTLQTAIVAAIIEKDISAWKISSNDSLEVLAIVYGGIMVTGISYYAQTWCIHKKGPVFTSSFSPLLIVFTFLLETLVLKKVAHLGSIVGAVLVVLGLYMLLWAKADDGEEKQIKQGDLNPPLKDLYKPLV